MKPAIWTDAFVELEPEDVLEKLASVGWKYIELAEKHWRDINKREKSERDFLNLKNLCKKLNISIVQMHGPRCNFFEKFANLGDQMKEAKWAIKEASVIGVKWVIFHPESISMAENEKAAEYVRQKNLDGFRILSKEASKSNVGIALENVFDDEGQGRRRFGAIPSELLWLVHNIDSQEMGVCWDTGHANMQKLNQCQAIKALGKNLVATHICDNDTSDDQHLLPFEGNIDWKAVITSLWKINYRGLFNLEIGGAVHKVPLTVRGAKLRYALELTKSLIVYPTSPCFPVDSRKSHK